MIGIVLAALLWGTTGTAATLLPRDVNPLATGAATMAIGGLLLGALTGRGGIRLLRERAARPWIALGALAVVAYPLAFYSAMSLAGVAVGNVVALGSAPVFAAVLERWIAPRGHRSPLTRTWMIAAGVAVVGIVLLALFGHDTSGAGRAGAVTGGSAAGSSTGLGVLLGLVAGLAYATYTCTAARLIRTGRRSSMVVGVQFGVGGLLLVPVLLATGAPLLFSDTPSAVADSPLHALLGQPPALLVVAYLALGPMFAAYLLFGRGLRTVASSRATTITLLEPFVATLLGVVAVGERLAPLGWLGLALVLAGVVVDAVVAARGQARNL
ncbi:DMT family transporter [Schumannella soli]|uniref:EamA family transporter n=1 Tax=Schumannella soli TaxID=2590779 RepID=A0A506Y7F4_9MICO|nr:EamA family transporter [Schumannella soli]TPW77450.1 EamA family transporter [Schumannella soli]